MSAATPHKGTRDTTFDPTLLAVLANRFEAIVREMTQTLLRAGRSAAINIARDFSCSITTSVTGAHELLAAAEGLPVHIYGSHLQAEAMSSLHSDLREGDAFLHNDPYLGNSHPADHTILVPIFCDGEHLFTSVAKAHLSDIGNALPTSYMPTARDVYEEGALLFPCVRIQQQYRDIDDIIRMCRLRIRVPEQWYGDYLAMLGAARVGERRITELVRKYGLATTKTFVREWLIMPNDAWFTPLHSSPEARSLAPEGMIHFPDCRRGFRSKQRLPLTTTKAGSRLICAIIPIMLTAVRTPHSQYRSLP